MKVQVMNIGDVKVLSIHGRVDALTAQQLQVKALETVHHSPKLLIDLSSVSYMSSAGLRVILLLHREMREHNGRVVLVGLQDRIRDAMEITGFLKHFSVVTDIQAGIEMIS